MPQIGPLELLVVTAIALIVFGPQKLPQIARSIGKAMSEFRRQASSIKSEFEWNDDDDDLDENEPAHTSPRSAQDPDPDVGKRDSSGRAHTDEADAGEADSGEVEAEGAETPDTAADAPPAETAG